VKPIENGSRVHANGGRVRAGPAGIGKIGAEVKTFHPIVQENRALPFQVEVPRGE